MDSDGQPTTLRKRRAESGRMQPWSSVIAKCLSGRSAPHPRSTIGRSEENIMGNLRIPIAAGGIVGEIDGPCVSYALAG